MKKQCKSCVYYPDDCGYWNESFRKKHSQASFFSHLAIHNCSDWVRKEMKRPAPSHSGA